MVMATPEFSQLRVEEAVAKAAPWLRQVGLGAELGGHYPTELSFGVQKRVAVARALAVGPKHLLFDEPTTGLDPIASDAIHALIRKVARDHGMTAVVVSHDLRRALAVADRVVLLDSGEPVFMGKPSEFEQCPHPTAKAFMAASRRELTRGTA